MNEAELSEAIDRILREIKVGLRALTQNNL